MPSLQSIGIEESIGTNLDDEFLVENRLLGPSRAYLGLGGDDLLRIRSAGSVSNPVYALGGSGDDTYRLEAATLLGPVVGAVVMDSGGAEDRLIIPQFRLSDLILYEIDSRHLLIFGPGVIVVTDWQMPGSRIEIFEMEDGLHRNLSREDIRSLPGYRADLPLSVIPFPPGTKFELQQVFDIGPGYSRALELSYQPIRAVGTDGPERLIGRLGNDVLVGLGGNDLLLGKDGVDILKGNEGTDKLWGGSERDFLLGGEGVDILKGEDGDDKLWGGSERDFLLGGEGVDILKGEEGDDKLWGGDDRDYLIGREGVDILKGDAGTDRIWGGDGTDYLFGGGDVDVLRGDKGNDSLYGGDGNDVLVGGLGNDLLNGGSGNDLFVIGPNEGSDTVVGLAIGDERLDLRLFGFVSGDAVRSLAIAGAGGIVVDLPGAGSIRLIGVADPAELVDQLLVL